MIGKSRGLIERGRGSREARRNLASDTIPQYLASRRAAGICLLQTIPNFKLHAVLSSLSSSKETSKEEKRGGLSATSVCGVACFPSSFLDIINTSRTKTLHSISKAKDL